MEVKQKQLRAELNKDFTENDIKVGCLISSKELSLYPEDEPTEGKIVAISKRHENGEFTILSILVWCEYEEELIRLKVGDFNVIGYPITVERVGGLLSDLNILNSCCFIKGALHIKAYKNNKEINIEWDLSKEITEETATQILELIKK